MNLTLVCGDTVCNLSYIGDGVVLDSTFRRDKQDSSMHPLYFKDKAEAYTVMIKTAYALLGLGYTIEMEDQ